MNDLFTPVHGTHFAEFHHDNGVYELMLPNWLGWLSRADAERALVNLRKFCDAAEAALTQTNQPVEEVKP